MGIKYTAQNIQGAKAKSVNLNCSPKHCMELCNAIKGMKAAKAESFLQNIIDKKQHLVFKKFNSGMAHKKGGQPGRYPVKASRFVLNLLKSAESNAEDMGMDKENLKIVHACAQRGPTYNRRRPKGRMATHDIDTVSIEIILQEAN